MDLMQVLEGAAYVGFIAGAIFAVLELRTLSRDRMTELLMRNNEYMCSREFEEASAKFIKARFKTPEEAEEQCGLPVLLMIADYCEGLGSLYQRKLVPQESMLDLLPFDYCWNKIKVWARATADVDDPDRDKFGLAYPHFEWLASEYTRRRLAAEQEEIGA